MPPTVTSSANPSTTQTVSSPVPTNPYCTPFQNPEEDESFCTCGSGNDDYHYSFASQSLCPYASPPPTSAIIGGVTTPTIATPFTSTMTYFNSDVVACTSFSNLDVAVPASVCVGSTIYTAPTPTPAYVGGTCRLHLAEISSSCDKDFLTDYENYDGSNALVVDGSRLQKVPWGSSQTLSSKGVFGYNVQVLWANISTDVVAGSKTKARRDHDDDGSKILVPERQRREVAPAPAPVCRLESWTVQITAGSATFWSDGANDKTSTVPYCSVGGWDNGNFGTWLDSLISEIATGGEPISDLPNRQMDCYWSC